MSQNPGLQDPVERGSTRFEPMANAIRALSMDAVEAANSGHPGMPMGMADAATVLWTEYMKYDASAPNWPDRDRFVLSAGHGSMLLYSLLHLTGFAHPTLEEISKFRQLESPCAGHPENFLLEGADATTGPLGQGLAMAVGMAIAERHLNAEFGDDLVDHRTWVIAGDGCLMEGINHEAIGLAAHLKLGRLIVLWDDNKITIDGSTDLSTSEDVRARYVATGWHVVDCDGHDTDEVRRALDEAIADPRPSLVACRTIIGKGAPNKQGTHKVHGAALGADEVAATRKALGWTTEAFTLPEDIAADWRAAGERGKQPHAQWQQRLASHSQGDEFTRRMAGELPASEEAAKVFSGWLSESKKVATRTASEMVLEVLTPLLPEMIGGSADLTPSNNTKTKAMEPFTRANYAGRYIHYGIREFGMVTAMNGMALHGGVIPYGGTFMIFSDYCRNGIRLAALSQIRVIYVLTHDSIGLGEDGPTHQPVEHVMSLRLIPNLNVFRPADLIETAECWNLALQARETPSVLALTRQNLPQLRTAENSGGKMLSARGAYTLRHAQSERRVILIATGSEVALAVDVAAALEAEGVGADVVSMPCMELFEQQEKSYRHLVLPPDPHILCVSIEAGVTLGWQRFTGMDGLNIGLDRFGASAPGNDLFKRFGFTVEAIVPKIKDKLAAGQQGA